MGGLGDMLIAQTGMFLRRVGPARFERRPTLAQSVKIVVGLRGETLLGPPWPAQKLGLVVGCGYPGSVPNGVLPRARCRWAGRLRPR